MCAWIDRHRRRLIAAGVVAIFGLIALPTVLRNADPAGKVRGDARRVYCLAAENRAALIDAAITLKKAAPGSTASDFRPLPGAATAVTFDQWSEDHQDGFDELCASFAALTAPRALQEPEPAPPWWRRLGSNPVLALALGSLLTFTTTRLAAGATRREFLADQLNSAASEYLKAADTVGVDRARAMAVDLPGLEGRKIELWSALLRQPLPDTEQDFLHRRLDDVHQTLVGSWPVDGKKFRETAVMPKLNGLRKSLEMVIRGGRVNTEGGDGV
jgi:hypothetical protein